MNFYPLEIFRKVLQRHLYSIAVEYFYCIFSHLFTFQVSWCPRQSALLAWAPPRWCPRSGGRCPPPWPPLPTSTPPSPPSSSLWWPSPPGPSPCFYQKLRTGRCPTPLMMSTGVHTEIFQSSGFNISFVWNHQFLCREKLCANYEKEAPAWIRKLTTRNSTWYEKFFFFICSKYRPHPHQTKYYDTRYQTGRNSRCGYFQLCRIRLLTNICSV